MDRSSSDIALLLARVAFAALFVPAGLRIIGTNGSQYANPEA